MFRVSLRKCSFFLLAVLGGACGADAGSPGEPGAAGQRGEAAAIALVQTQTVAPGDDCASGGQRIISGHDADHNGELSDDEIAAGSTTLVCAAASAECDSPVQITGVTGTDQTFFNGVESASLNVGLSSTTGVELHFLAPDLEVNQGTTPGEFTIVAHAIGGPFQVAVVASDGCSFDVANFAIDTVEPELGVLRQPSNERPMLMSASNTPQPHGVTL